MKKLQAHLWWSASYNQSYLWIRCPVLFTVCLLMLYPALSWLLSTSPSALSSRWEPVLLIESQRRVNCDPPSEESLPAFSCPLNAKKPTESIYIPVWTLCYLFAVFFILTGLTLLFSPATIYCSVGTPCWKSQRITKKWHFFSTPDSLSGLSGFFIFYYFSTFFLLGVYELQGSAVASLAAAWVELHCCPSRQEGNNNKKAW